MRQRLSRQRGQNKESENQQRSGHDDTERDNQTGEQIKQNIPDDLPALEQIGGGAQIVDPS